MIELQEGWNQLMEEGILPLQEFLETGVVLHHKTTGSSHTESSSSSTAQRVSLFRPRQFMQLYTLVYTMSTQRREMNYSQQLYERHGKAIEDYVQTKVVPSLKGKTGLELLKEAQRRWENHLILNNWMERIFSYLDRYHIKANMQPCLRRKGLNIFRTQVMSLYGSAIRQGILDMINQEREGATIDRGMMKSLISLYIELGAEPLVYYHDELEKYLLPATRDIYAQKANAWLSSLSFADYMKAVESAIQEETERCRSYLHELTCPKILAVVQKALLTDNMSELLAMDSALGYLLREGKLDDIKRTFVLFSSLEDGTAPIAKEFRNYIAARGSQLIDQHTTALTAEVAEAQKNEVKNLKSIIQKQLSNVTVIQDLLALHDHFKHLTTICFNQELLFKRALKEAFEEFMNRTIGSHSTAAFLSSFCDQLMRNRTQGTSDATIEETLGKVVELFTFLADKDLFADIYRTQLARRLLTETSSSADTERLMIAKLKMTCGPQFTSRLEGMLNDLSVAYETQRDFRRRLIQSSEPEDSLCRSQFSTMVLTTGYWPTYQTPDVVLPPEMHHCLDVFTQYYIGVKTSHRRLTWVHHLGSVQLSARFPQGRMYTIQCNTFQACILLLFNSTESLSVNVITETLKLDATLARKLLASFLVVRLLMKKKGDTEGSEEYCVNDAFVSKQRIIKIPVPAQDELHNKDKIEEDRSVAIEAAIVRIMKSRKTLSHTDLVLEVLNQLRFFKPNPRVIKTKIESLIDREFLERCPDNAQHYNYLA